MRVVLASKSPIKAEAVRLVYGDDIVSLVCVAAESGVPAQPVGQDETLLGAKNRVRNAQAMVEPGSYDLVIAMENGIWKGEHERWFDGAVVVVFSSKNGTTRVAWSDTLQICETVNCRVACAHPQVVPGRDGLWSTLKDPHAEFGKPRKEYLRDALQSIK